MVDRAGRGVAVLWVSLDAPWATSGWGGGFVPLREDGGLDPALVALRLLDSSSWSR
jgi:hypothetical protein